MKTLRLNLSRNAIEIHQGNTDVQQLRDNRQSVYYRFKQKDRNLGTFYGVFHKQGKTQWIKLGCYPALSAKDSLSKMSQLTKEAALKSTIPNDVEFKTVGELLAWYIKRQANNKALAEHTKKNQQACIKQHLLPLLGHIKISSISLPLIDEVLFQPLQAKLALSTVDNILSVLNAAIKRAIQVQLIQYNPLPKCTLAEFTNQRPKVKATRLTQSSLLNAIKNLNKQSVEHQLLFVLLVLHGTRIGETVNAKWEAFDFEQKLWRIPAQDTKTKKSHLLPLTELAITWLKFYKKHQMTVGKSIYLFPQKSNKRKAMSPNQGSCIISAMAKKQWSAHDLRKFARSFWMELGIDYMVGEFLLNHTLNKLNQSYIQTLAMPNCRAALSDWSQWLEEQGLTPSYKRDLRKWKRP
jgi:integrase